jgi:hypothetical protein
MGVVADERVKVAPGGVIAHEHDRPVAEGCTTAQAGGDRLGPSSVIPNSRLPTARKTD